mmetsp:Transcript_43972/g.145670  ORF Transcript_43972/g.145670 Transcript_43972/m.145670 type:complete len:209 (+) Transcript_43972:216-842(+)
MLRARPCARVRPGCGSLSGRSSPPTAASSPISRARSSTPAAHRYSCYVGLSSRQRRQRPSSPVRCRSCRSFACTAPGGRSQPSRRPSPPPRPTTPPTSSRPSLGAARAPRPSAAPSSTRSSCSSPLYLGGGARRPPSQSARWPLATASQTLSGGGMALSSGPSRRRRASRAAPRLWRAPSARRSDSSASSTPSASPLSPRPRPRPPSS